MAALHAIARPIWRYDTFCVHTIRNHVRKLLLHTQVESLYTTRSLIADEVGPNEQNNQATRYKVAMCMNSFVFEHNAQKVSLQFMPSCHKSSHI